ncbi:MAG: AAA family ATPase [Candidatus Dormibacteria bacterium]
MDGIQFADGFDTPDRLAFGLGAPQLIVVATGSLLAFGLVHLPVPGALSVPAAAMVVLLAAALGWLRCGGRPLLDWALFALGHLARPRNGMLVAVTSGAPHGGRTPVVLRSAVLSASNIVRLPLRPEPAQPVGAAARARPTGRRGAHRVVFFSLKGGTGRTTLSTESAAWLAGRIENGAQSVLIDCDLRSASVGGRLGLAGAGIVEYALARPDERRLDSFMARHDCGLRVLLGPSQPANPTWPVTPAVLREVLRELDLCGAVTVVVDVSADLNDLTRAALRAADDVMVVVVPTTTGILDAYRTTEQLRRLGLRDRIGYVVNRARGGLDVTVAMRDLGGEVLAEIPEDGTLTDAENAHWPAVLGAAGAASFELRRLAGRLAVYDRGAGC